MATAGGGENINPAYEAFRKHSADLLTVIQDPEVLAWELYAENIIPAAVRDAATYMMHERDVRTSNLLMAVKSQTKVDPEAFDVFLSVLARRPSMSDLCKRMKETYSTFQQPHPPYQPRSLSPPQPRRDVTPVLQYAAYLKSVYTSKKAPIYRWPQVKCKKYIHLALIEKDDITKPEVYHFTYQFMRATIHGIKRSKRATYIGQIAQLPDGSQPKCILVEGVPGVGKSTFAWKLCYKWGKGKLLQQYQLVVLLRLRDKRVRTAMNISDLFQYHDHQIQQAVVEEMQRTGGKGVLLLFEGYDELPEKLRTENSIFIDIITGRVLPETTVLITSRPWASEFLHMKCKRHIFQHIEILGFTKANIQSYLESTIADDPSLLADLKKYISCYPHIRSLMYIPLNSAIVVEVYRNSKKDETMTELYKSLVLKTMTELYSSLVRSLLLRYLLDHPVHGKKRWRIRSFSDLPKDVYQQLCELGRIAYEGILHDQQVIFSDIPEDFETLGLMQCVPELYADEGAAVSYNFLHLTIQEYLAAFHLSQQPVQKQIEHFREYCSGEDKQSNTHIHMVLQFLSGVRKFSGYLSELLNVLCVEIGESDMESNSESGDDSDTAIREFTFNTLHWLFEAQDKEVIENVLGSGDIQLHASDEYYEETPIETGIHLHEPYGVAKPFDCFVLGYCVSHSNCTWTIGLKSCHIGDEGVEMLVRGAVEEETDCTGGISMLDLSENSITSRGVKHLLNIPKKLIKELETLGLCDNDLDSASCTALAHLIPHVPHLKELHLSENSNIGQDSQALNELLSSSTRGAVSLVTSLIAHNSLEILHLRNTGIGVEDSQALNELLSSSTSRLKKLSIGDKNLTPDAIELIISGLRHSKTIKRLDMWGSHFSLQNIKSLASVLRMNHTLIFLNLGQCEIDSSKAHELATALCTNDTLQELSLCNNPIGAKGAAAFAEMLHKNKSLKELDLRDDSIGEEGTQKLNNALMNNTILKKLWLPRKYKLTITSGKADYRVIFHF